MMSNPSRKAAHRLELTWCWLAGLIATGLIASGCVVHRAAPLNPADLQPVPIEETRSIEEAVRTAHNAERLSRGLAPVRLDPRLTQAAQSHADDMARRGRLGHQGGEGSSPFDRIERTGFTYRAAGENVAVGRRTVAEVMGDWMRSRRHRANILGEFAAIGAGRAVAPNGATYWCVTFGTPRAAVSHETSRPSAMVQPIMGDGSAG